MVQEQLVVLSKEAHISHQSKVKWAATSQSGSWSQGQKSAKAWLYLDWGAKEVAGYRGKSTPKKT